MVSQSSGDVQARVLVRALEMLESIRLICDATTNMPPGPLRAFEGLPSIPEGEATARSEAPRGEVIYYVATDGSDHPSRVKIRTPSFVNIPAIESMSPGEQLGDMPLIQASVDPCLSCTDR
jgi:Ni,Fe-hydrogenase III large subunit